MTSDKDLGKKMVEGMDLEYFLDAYEDAVSQRLIVVGTGERPDFICQRPNGDLVGVELTAVPTDTISVTDDLYGAVATKADKRARGDWQLAFNTILVLVLNTSPPLSELKYALDEMPKRDFDQGFAEVWVADYSGVDAYGNVELYGLFPEVLWGLHRRPNWFSKPYG